MGRQEEGDVSSPIARALDELLRTHRNAKGEPVSIESLAAELDRKGLSAPYLYALRSGRKRNPNPENLQALANYFGVNLGFFYGGDRGRRAVKTVEPVTEATISNDTGADQSVTDIGPDSAVRPSPQADLAARLEHLFTLRLRPNGEPWSMRQVMLAARAQGVALSVTFLHDLRRGIRDNPTKQQLECLARIFDVSPAYFFDDEDTIAHVDDKLRQLGALDDPRVADIACRARGLSDHDYRMLQYFIDSAINARGYQAEPPA